MLFLELRYPSNHILDGIGRDETGTLKLPRGVGVTRTP